MLKRATGLFTALIMFFALLPVIEIQANVIDYDKIGHIAIRVMPERNTTYHNALIRGNRIYLSGRDIASITGYDYEYNVGVTSSEIHAFFSRRDDVMTRLLYEYGQAHTIGHTFDLQTIIRNGQIYFDIEKMLYLLHAQWVVEDNYLVVQPMSESIFGFVNRNFEYINANRIGYDKYCNQGVCSIKVR